MEFLEEPTRIDEQTWDKGTKPLVTVSCITYNHEEFIREAIESFLMQKTTFPVEILIHDDASTDGTADIIREYENAYPGLIKPIYQTENQYSKGIKIPATYQHSRTKGKYYAICEGDDYWIDPLKLQKQVSFLEENDEYVLACGGFVRLDNKTGDKTEEIKFFNKRENSAGYTFDKYDLKKGWIAKTLTVICRRSALTGYNTKKYNYSRDVHLIHHLLEKGKGFYFTDLFGVYRLHSQGVFSPQSEIERIQQGYNIYKEIYENYQDDTSRFLYLNSLKCMFSAGLVTIRSKNYFTKIKKAFSLTVSFREVCLLLIALIPPLHRFVYKWRPLNQYNQKQ